jgi:hypothetical protein
VAYAAANPIADLAEPPPLEAEAALPGTDQPYAEVLPPEQEPAYVEPAAAEHEPGPPNADDAAAAPLAPDAEAFDQIPQTQDPVAVIDAPALAPMEQGNTALPADAALPEDIETAAARRARLKRRSGLRWPMPSLPTAILALVAVNIGLIGWRADVVRLIPQTASLYAAIGLPVNLRGLVFANVTTETETQDGVQVLVVEGVIASVANRAVEVPRLRFAVRNGSGHEIYSWTALPPRKQLAPGDTMEFRSRLASPPREGNDVLVRFFSKRDLGSGIQ